MLERFGIFVVKGLVEFKDQLAVLVLANLTDKSINLPAGTIVANLDIFSDDEWDTHEPNKNKVLKNNEIKLNKSTEKLNKVTKKQIKSIIKQRSKTRNFIVNERDEPNKFLNWKPILKRKQCLMVNENSKLVQVVDTLINLDSNKKQKLEKPGLVVKKKSEMEISPDCTGVIKQPHENVAIDENNLTTEELK